MFLTLPQLLLFIVLLHQQQPAERYAAWATSTLQPSEPPNPAAAAAATSTTAAVPLAAVAVSSSEATLLTAQSHFAPLQQQRHDTVAVQPKTTDELNAESPRYKIVALHTNCTRDMFAMQFALNRDFRGILYAQDFPLECRAHGTAEPNVTLRLPTSGCGVRVEPRSDGHMELSVRVMLQMEQKLRQSSDILRMVRCQLPPNAMGMMVVTTTTATTRSTSSKQLKTPRLHAKLPEGKLNYRNGRMRSLNFNNDNATAVTAEGENVVNTTEDAASGRPPTETVKSTTSSSSTSTPRVRIWLELGGLDGSGAVEVGQATTLTVRAIVPGTMGVRVVDCAALDGLGESKQQLLDEQGCTIDEQVMPPLHTHFKPAEEGWSKHEADDLVEKVFSATFPAFKFPDRERLHVSCGVQLCKGKCPNLNCHSSEQLNMGADKQLARIEVFNSLAVTAPQIEVDRLRYNRRYNMSVEEYPPQVRPLPSEGTLCLSVSKLAISFCVLGLIFLGAIIVAILSLLRSRRRAMAQTCISTPSSARLQRAEVCTSMFSSSSESAQSARFGSKLFMPYYPNTLPYGRVY